MDSIITSNIHLDRTDLHNLDVSKSIENMAEVMTMVSNRPFAGHCNPFFIMQSSHNNYHLYTIFLYYNFYIIIIIIIITLKVDNCFSIDSFAKFLRLTGNTDEICRPDDTPDPADQEQRSCGELEQSYPSI